MWVSLCACSRYLSLPTYIDDTHASPETTLFVFQKSKPGCIAVAVACSQRQRRPSHLGLLCCGHFFWPHFFRLFLSGSTLQGQTWPSPQIWDLACLSVTFPWRNAEKMPEKIRNLEILLSFGKCTENRSRSSRLGGWGGVRNRSVYIFRNMIHVKQCCWNELSLQFRISLNSVNGESVF